ncbi:MAG TPA: GGDEF domain-containing protein, partial [Steroidobacteraceae bacterium]|nr:GGDEF domain-containing protein [Steroidobacteraceae bacterium]
MRVCDLDRFKRINDSLGHRAGDQLLQEVARRLSAVARTADTVVRFGGDEFVLVGSSLVDAEDAMQLAARAIEALRAPVRIAGIDVPSLRISVNLSASQFREAGLVDSIRRALDDVGLLARYLEVEL